MLSEAQAFWSAIEHKVKDTIRDTTKSCLRCGKFTVTTVPDGKVMGIKTPMTNAEIKAPYSASVADVQVGDTVLAFWWGTMSTIKVWYKGAGPETNYNRILSAVYPVGSVYLSANKTNPTAILGGTWARVDNAYLVTTDGAANTNVTVWQRTE